MENKFKGVFCKTINQNREKLIRAFTASRPFVLTFRNVGVSHIKDVWELELGQMKMDGLVTIVAQDEE